MATVIGIDLGTSYSLAAKMDHDEPRVLPNALGEALTPSAVSVDDDGHILIGAAALARSVTHPERTAVSFKRDMGTDKVRILAGRRYRPEELSALVLQAVKRDAEHALGASVDEAVVTVPAYFGELQRRATRDACRIAGLNVERIVNEPTAAAMAYGLHHTDSELRAVVLDLGGGTFDVTVLEIIEGVIEIQASAGDTQLGGDDFATELVELVRGRIAKQHGTPPAPSAKARLIAACEAAKRRLSEVDATTIALPELALAEGGKADVEMQLRRAACEEAWESLLVRMRSPIRRALRDAGIRPANIDEVLLVGGATRMPCVVELAAKVFDRIPQRTLPPDEAVALGAAVQADLKIGTAAVQEIVVTDIAPFTLGVSSGRKMTIGTVQGIFTPVLERGTVLPASRVKSFFTMDDWQTVIHLDVYQGEHAMCSDNQQLGRCVIEGVPSKKAGEEQVDVRFTYDLNGILEVDATIVSSGKTTSLLIEQAPGRLTADEISAARAAMATLKFHPRDALPNRTALARAEALFTELTGPRRQVLSEALSAFRLALEIQDPEIVGPQRSELVRVTAQLARE